MTNNNKKQYRKCPNCSDSIHSKNFRAALKRCKKCYKTVCVKCRLNDLCVDCYVIKNYNKYYAPTISGVRA